MRTRAGALNLKRWAHLFERRVRPVTVKKMTGFEGESWGSAVPALRRHRYFVEPDRSVSGDAPKDFIHVYEPGHGSRDNPRSWPAHIAKVGHKWYPAESITEQLLTRVGEAIGVEMAQSQLMNCEGQIRFLSRYFLNDRQESLVHGADIVASYVQDDCFVEDVGRSRMEPDLFTHQVLCEAIRVRFPAEADELSAGFAEMIAFDALVGNQDRHLNNWGVIVHVKGRRRARFAPIYDTARGLFWNHSDDRLDKFKQRKVLDAYVDFARPLIGWDYEQNVNHFRMVENMSRKHPEHRDRLLCLCSPRALKAACTVVDTGFDRLLSRARRDRIKECLQLRFERYEAAVMKGATC